MRTIRFYAVVLAMVAVTCFAAGQAERRASRERARAADVRGGFGGRVLAAFDRAQ